MNQQQTRVGRAARRIVLMFELYKQNIDPSDETFIMFISDYLNRKNLDSGKAPYHELYFHIRGAIKEYLQAGESKQRKDR